MVLKRNILSALSFLFNLFLVHSLDYDSCFEPFDVSCIKFSNENIIVVTHNIRCNETTVENEYILLNKLKEAIVLPITIECSPLGFGTVGNHIVIPYDFNITSQNDIIKYSVLKNNSLIDITSLYKEHCLVDDKIEINFSLIIPESSSRSIVISYRNLQSGKNQVNMNYWYNIHLYKNPNGEPVNMSFAYNASRNPELYISSIDIKNSRDESVLKSMNVERSDKKTTKWSFRLPDYMSSENNEYLKVSLLYYGLDTEDSRLYIRHNGDTIYWNNEDLMTKLIKQQDLFFLSNDQLRLLRNAFYAIHGYDFKSQDLKEYFSGFSWYKPNPNFSESDFTEIERKNIELIRQMENQEEPLSSSECLK